ncbi:MAG: helix-turn-helix domain-containing protein [Clostridia bacterium]|nr:helix-turn-helix domain-containing protein [Clostridia bacterium]
MISYRPFWETLNKRDISTYELIYRQGVSANTIYRMKRGMPITTKTINDLCFILDCSVSDIIEYIKDND